MTQPEADLNELYLEFVDPIQNYLYRLSGDRTLAEDLVQEVFYRAMRQLLGGKRIDCISAWLFRIARNLYLDHAKKKRPALEPEVAVEHLSSDFGQPEKESLRRERHNEILRALHILPESQRTALILRDVHGLSYDEVAEVMDLSLSAVKSCLFRARRRFTEVYHEYESEGYEHA